MATEFDNALDYAPVVRGPSKTLTNGNGYALRWSSVTLAALRSVGFLDNMVDGTVPPVDTSMLWLDKNSDPAILKEYNPVGAAWEQVTSQTLFGRVPWRGPWDDEPIYRRGDVVSYNGAIWICILPSQNHPPSEDAYWDLFIPALPDNSVTTAKIVDGGVTTPKLADRSVTKIKIAQGIVTFDTEALFAAATITNDIIQVETAGYFASGDGGGHRKLRIATPSPVKAWHKQSADGAWWEIAKGQDVKVEMFGARPLSQAALIAKAGVVTTEIAANDAALLAADAFVAANGGGRIFALGQFYVVSARYERSSGVYLIGAGVGEWEPIFPGRPKTWSGTTFLFKGTGTRDLKFDGITSLQHGGGWREDPDNLGTYFKLWSAYNSDATGTAAATQKSFSAGILMKENVRYGGIQHLRLCNWIGTDGISDWSNQASASIGDDWDFGYLIRNGEYTDDYNIQVVGGWRQFAHMLCATAISDSTAERNRIVRGKFNGRRGLGVRGPDIWKVTAKTSNSVTIRWTSEIYFNPAGGTFRGSDNVTYTYTGVAHTGTANDYVFTGVTPDPNAAGIFEVRHPSSGFGNTEYQDVYSYGLDHVSGSKAAVLGYSDSKALEISGFPVRGVKFRNSKFHTGEPVCVHSHINQDIVFMDCQFEGGGHFLATPATADQTYTAAPVRETRGLINLASAGMNDGVDSTLFLPRNAFVEELQLAPRSDLTGDLIVKPLRSGKVLDFYGSDLASFFRFEEKTVTTAGLSFATVTSQTCTWRYVKIGKMVFFKMTLTWSGLDTADTSAISIRLPVNAASATGVMDGTINDRLSTGITLAGADNPYIDFAADDYLGISISNTTRLAYNGGQIAASGNLYISGKYWID
ncbi:hypothetical protein [Rhizobium sp. 21-4511-3d]